MRTRAPLPVMALAILGVAWAGSVPVAAQRPAALQGTVWDSTVAVPLAGATVALFGTRLHGTTDADGRFRLEDVPAGDHTVVFFHPRLAELGVSTGPAPVRLTQGRTTTVELAIPSMHTLRATQCLFEPGSSGVAVGRVIDAATGVPLPGADVEFTWSGNGSVAIRSDQEGWFRLCHLPVDRALAVRASFFDRSSMRQEFVITGAPAHLELMVTGQRPGRIAGRLLDVETGRPVAGAVVELRDTDHYATSGSDGAFLFADVDPGSYMLTVAHIAYGPRHERVLVTSGATLGLEVPLAMEAIELPPITVTAEGATLVERAMGGQIITRGDIDEVLPRSRDVADLLRAQSVSGLVVDRRGGELCVGFITGQVRMTRRGCVPAVVFVDNVRQTSAFAAFEMAADAIDHMILYRPVEAGNLFGLGGGNGVVMIFTKRRD